MDELQETRLRELLREEVRKALSGGSGQNELLTPEETAKLLKVKPQTLALWRHQGKHLNYLKLADSTVRYEREEISRWKQTHAVKVH